MVSGNVWQRRTGGAYSPRDGRRDATSSPSLTNSTGRRSKLSMSLGKFSSLCQLLLLVGVMGVGMSATAGTPAKRALDTIVLTSGGIKVGTLKNIFGSNVYYVDTIGQEHSLRERNVHRIIYSTGRTQTLNQKAVVDVSEDDWKIVMLVDDAAQVDGLYARGVVSGKSSPTNKTKQSAQRSAETRIKKRCVAKGGIVVLVTKRLTTGGYGETPSYYIEGEAYGSEPLEEGAEDGGESSGSSDD